MSAFMSAVVAVVVVAGMTTTAGTSTAGTPRPGAFAAEGPVVAVQPFELKARELRLSGLSYHGVVTLRTVRSTKRALKFTVTGLRITSMVQTVRAGDFATTLAAPPGSVSTILGDRITLYTEELKGLLMLGPVGVPVDFTPDKPPPLTLPSLRFRKVTVTNAAMLGGTLRISGATVDVERVGRAS